MSANISDLITDTRNAARPNSTTVSAPRSTGGSSLSCANLTGWPTASKVHFVTYKIDSNSAVIAGTQLDCYGIVSGNTIGSFTIVDGTDSGNAIGDIVEMLPTAAWGQDLASALTSTHNRNGGLKTGIALTAPSITDFTSATHTHASNSQGAQLNATNALQAGSVGFANLLSTIFSGQVTSVANAGNASGTNNYINLGGIKLLWGTSGTVSLAGAAPQSATFSTNFPVFFNTIQAAVATVNGTATGTNFLTIGSIAPATTSGWSIQLISTAGSNGSTNISWFVIGT